MAPEPRFVIEADAYKPPADGFSYRMLNVAEVDPPTDVASALYIRFGDRAVLRHRLRLHGDTVVEVSQSYYPLPIVAGSDLTRPGKIRGGAPRVLAELGFAQRRFQDRVSVREATDEEISLLGLPPGELVFQQFRVVYAGGDQPVEASILVKSGQRCELMYWQNIDS